MLGEDAGERAGRAEPRSAGTRAHLVHDALPVEQHRRLLLVGFDAAYVVGLLAGQVRDEGDHGVLEQRPRRQGPLRGLQPK